MINYVYQLVNPKVFSIKYEDISVNDKVIIRPEYMAICHADQRYYQGKRDSKVLAKKLPMALIHECAGKVVCDPTGTFKIGQKVVMIPNDPQTQDDEIYENYLEGGRFLSSGYDGFMQELKEMRPDRVVPYDNIKPQIAAMTEFVSVAVHSATRFDRIAHSKRNVLGIWGDGSLGYVLACVLKKLFPNSKIAVIGHQPRKLQHFSFVDYTFTSDTIPDDFRIDHAFECCGGEGCSVAIDDIIRYIRPQGTVMLMGVSENKVPIYTRNVLEKGLTMVGCSRSGREDFEKAIEIMDDDRTQKRLNVIVFEDDPVKDIADFERVFGDDLNTPFKTVFKWDV